jgi:hypothetical protein
MPTNACQTRQLSHLQAEWPRACANLQATYFPAPDWAVTDNHGHNPAGYMLWALQRFADIAADRYAQHQFTPAELDLAASQEITYLWLHDRRWTHTPAALALA